MDVAEARTKKHLLDVEEASYGTVCALVLAFFLVWTVFCSWSEPAASRRLQRAYNFSRYAQVKTYFGRCMCLEMSRSLLAFFQQSVSLALAWHGFAQKHDFAFLVGLSSELGFRLTDLVQSVLGRGRHEDDDLLVRGVFVGYNVIVLLYGFFAGTHLHDQPEVKVIYVGLIGGSFAYAVAVLIQFAQRLMEPAGSKFLVLVQVFGLLSVAYFRFCHGIVDGTHAYLKVFWGLEHAYLPAAIFFAVSAYLTNFVYGAMLCFLIAERMPRTRGLRKKLTEAHRRFQDQNANPSESEMAIYGWTEAKVADCLLMSPQSMLTHYIRRYGLWGKKKKASKKAQ